MDWSLVNDYIDQNASKWEKTRIRMRVALQVLRQDGILLTMNELLIFNGLPPCKPVVFCSKKDNQLRINSKLWSSNKRTDRNSQHQQSSFI